MIIGQQKLSQQPQDLILTLLVALTALLPRLIGLTAFLTADEPKSWFGRSIQFLTALARADFAATFDSPAPGVTTMWAGSLGLLLEYARQGFPGSLPDFLAALPFDPLNPAILPLIRLPIVLVAVAAAPLTWWWGRRPLGRPAALLAALFLALDPFLLGLTRILGHDGLVTLFMWLSLLAIINYELSIINSTPNPLNPPNSPNPPFTPHSSLLIIISGLLGGLAFLTKYPSLFLGAFVAGSMLVAHWRSESPWRRWLPRWAIEVALWSLAAGAVFVLLWPAMWVDPVGRVTAIISDALRASGAPHPKGSFFFGQPVPDPGPSYYLLVTLFKTTPILWLGWLLALLGLLTGNRWTTPAPGWRQTTLTVLAFGLLYGLLVPVGGKKTGSIHCARLPRPHRSGRVGLRLALADAPPPIGHAGQWHSGRIGRRSGRAGAAHRPLLFQLLQPFVRWRPGSGPHHHRRVGRGVGSGRRLAQSAAPRRRSGGGGLVQHHL
jgi:hypothetical protein